MDEASNNTDSLAPWMWHQIWVAVLFVFLIIFERNFPRRLMDALYEAFPVPLSFSLSTLSKTCNRQRIKTNPYWNCTGGSAAFISRSLSNINFVFTPGIYRIMILFKGIWLGSHRQLLSLQSQTTEPLVEE